MNTNIILFSILLLPVIYGNSELLKDHQDDPNWMQYLPNHVVHILKSRKTTLDVSNEESSLSIQESNSTESLNPDEARDSSVTPEVMHGYGDSQNSSDNTVRVGVPIGSIILFILICYCCFRCCRNRQTISQGIVVQPHPPPQDLNQPNIVIQHIHATPNLQAVHPGIVHHQPAPPQMVQHIPPQFQHAPPHQQFQQQPPYPTGYETRQMLEQEWSPHAPMNQQQQQQYPAPDYPYNPSAPPPSYRKY